MATPPEDFPRRTMQSGLDGAVLKFSARRTEDGWLSALVPDDVHQEPYKNALDLSTRLVGYALRKERENSTWGREFNLKRIQDGLKEKVRVREWDFTPDEQEWIMKRLSGLLE
ncbi:hypothetical protein [Castellaniella sp.]|uniref:hypothetical protein n=1 Tax=Castellaniella sp. TaxID=1955812 RepID=UPI003C72A380